MWVSLVNCFIVCPTNLTGNYMFKVNNRNSRTRYAICSELILKARHRHCSGVFIVNFWHIWYLVSIFTFEQVNAGWEVTYESLILSGQYIAVYWQATVIWDKVFKNGASKISDRDSWILFSILNTAQKWSFPLKITLVNVNPTFLCSVRASH